MLSVESFKRIIIMTSSMTTDPALIEQDIRRTQETMSATVDRIGDQLTLKNIFNTLLDKADENNVNARMLLDGARRNPVALGLIAAGTIWLVSEKDAKFSSFHRKSRPFENDYDDTIDSDHRDYIAHMSGIQQRSDEDAADYQRRRDHARANYFMVERGYDEDDSAFQKRLDAASEKFREKRAALASSSAEAASAAKLKAQAAATKAQSFYADNPLVGGIMAAAIGAAFGSTLPVSRREQETLGSLGQQARDKIGEQKDLVAAQIRDKKDELLEKADLALKTPVDADETTKELV
jgi:hypothetical protein